MGREADAVDFFTALAAEPYRYDFYQTLRRLECLHADKPRWGEALRPLELDALVGAVREIGQRVGIATPNIDALFGLTRLFGRVRGLYPHA